jgi:hypothetical protein
MEILFRMLDGPATLPIEVKGVLGGLIIALLIFLIQLRPAARVTTLVLMIIATLVLCKMFFTSVLMGTGLPVKAQVSMGVMLMLNTLTLVYLTRPSFADLCKAYRAEKEESARDRYAQKLLRQTTKLCGPWHNATGR